MLINPKLYHIKLEHILNFEYMKSNFLVSIVYLNVIELRNRNLNLHHLWHLKFIEI